LGIQILGHSEESVAKTQSARRIVISLDAQKAGRVLRRARPEVWNVSRVV